MAGGFFMIFRPGFNFRSPALLFINYSPGVGPTPGA